MFYNNNSLLITQDILNFYLKSEINIFVLGRNMIGKTNFISKLIKGIFYKNTLATLGPNSSYYELKINNKKLNLILQEIPEKLIYIKLFKKFSKRANIFILLIKTFKSHSKNNFNDLDRLINIIREKKEDKYKIGNRFNYTNEREVEMDEIINKCKNDNLIWTGEYNLKTCSKEELENMMTNIIFNIENLPRLLFGNIGKIIK